jgi:hypothetical protein
MLSAHQHSTALAEAESRLAVLFKEKISEQQALKRLGDPRKRVRMQSHQVSIIQNAILTVYHQCGNKMFRSILLL